MNRKLLVIAIVPLLVGFAGAMAFSEFGGNMTKTIGVTTGTISATEQVECIGGHIQGTVTLWLSYSEGTGSTTYLPPIELDGGAGHDYGQSGCPLKVECSDLSYGFDPFGVALGPKVTFLGPTIDTATWGVQISYLGPGDWIELALVDSITASPGLEASLYGSVAPSALAGTVISGVYAPASGAGFAPSDHGGWTYLKDPNPCRYDYVPTGGPINEGAAVSQNLGLEYCDSGALASATPPSGSALAPAVGPLTVGSQYLFTTDLLVGFDESAVNADMGVSGSITVSTSVTSP